MSMFSPVYSPMIRSAPRLFLRSSQPLIRPLRPQRHFSLAPPSQRSRSWRNVTVRWALAICGIYYYNTSNVFAEEPISTTLPPLSPTDETSVETLESLAATRRQSKDASSNPSTIPSGNSPGNSLPHSSSVENSSSLDETEEEASQQGAFNEETGEINWDCPCLGGMAHGPCGEEFRASFSCFVFSKEDPKGMDCIEHFKNMQDCFRRHPETYGSEMDDDDDRYEGDTEPPSYPIDDSANSPSSPGDTPTPPNDQTDQRTENNPPSPQSASPHPQVDEPSIYPQPPLDPPQPSSSSALQPASPAHERNRESEPIAAPNSLSDAEQSKIDLRN